MSIKSILIVDDDQEIRQLLQEYLQRREFQVHTMEDGNGLQDTLDAVQPDIAILDLLLPGDDGIALARQIRAHPTWNALPIIMLSAHGDDTEKILGLEAGADDYMVKPFNPRELLARINALGRRSQRAPSTQPSTTYAFGPFNFDMKTLKLTEHGQPVSLTTAERDLLECFLKTPNTTLSRDHLLTALMGRNLEPYDRSIDVRITRLRKKIEPDPANPMYIQTVRGKGYLFALPTDRD